MILRTALILVLTSLCLCATADTVDGVTYYLFNFNESIHTKTFLFTRENRTTAINVTSIRCHNVSQIVSSATSSASPATSTTLDSNSTSVDNTATSTPMPTAPVPIQYENITVCENVTETTFVTESNVTQGPSDWATYLTSARVVLSSGGGANYTTNLTTVASMWALAASECSSRGMSVASVRTLAQWTQVSKMAASSTRTNIETLFTGQSPPSQVYPSYGRLPFYDSEIFHHGPFDIPLQRFVMSNNSNLATGSGHEGSAAQKAAAASGPIWIGGGSSSGGSGSNDIFRWASGRWAGSPWWSGPVNGSRAEIGERCLGQLDYSRQNQWVRHQATEPSTTADWSCNWAPNFPSNRISSSSLRPRFNSTRVSLSSMLNETTEAQGDESVVNAFLFDFGSTGSLAELPWEVLIWMVDSSSSSNVSNNAPVTYRVTLRPMGGFVCMVEDCSNDLDCSNRSSGVIIRGNSGNASADATMLDPSAEFWSNSHYTTSLARFGLATATPNVTRYFTNSKYRAALESDALFATSTPMGPRVDEGCQCGICLEGWSGRRCDGTASQTYSESHSNSPSLSASLSMSESRSNRVPLTNTQVDTMTQSSSSSVTFTTSLSGTFTHTLTNTRSLMSATGTKSRLPKRTRTASFTLSMSPSITHVVTMTRTQRITKSQTLSQTTSGTVSVKPSATHTKVASRSLTPHICSKQDMTPMFIFPLFWFPPNQPNHGGYPIRFTLKEKDVRDGTAINPFSRNFWREAREKYWTDDDPRWASSGPLYGFWDNPTTTGRATVRPREREMQAQGEEFDVEREEVYSEEVYSAKDEMRSYLVKHLIHSDSTLAVTADIMALVEAVESEEGGRYNASQNANNVNRSNHPLSSDTFPSRFMNVQADADNSGDTAPNVTDLWLLSPFPIIMDIVYPGDTIPLIGRYMHSVASSSGQPNPYGFERVIEDFQASATDGKGFPLIGIAINWTHFAIALAPLPTYSLGIDEHVDIYLDTRYLGYCGGGSPAFTSPSPFFHVSSFTILVDQGEKEEAAKGVVLASAVLSGMAAPEAQTITVISLMRCSNPKYQSLAKYRALSPFAPFSDENVGLGSPGAGGPMGALLGIGMFISFVLVVQVLAVLGVRIYMCLRPLTREERRAIHNLGKEIIKAAPTAPPTAVEGIASPSMPSASAVATTGAYVPPQIVSHSAPVPPAAETSHGSQLHQTNINQQTGGGDASVEDTGGDVASPVIETGSQLQYSPNGSPLRKTNIKIHRSDSSASDDQQSTEFKTRSRFWNAEETDLVRSPVRSGKAVRRRAGLERDHTTDEESEVEDVNRWEIRQQEKEMERMGLDPALLHISDAALHDQLRAEGAGSHNHHGDSVEGVGSLVVPLQDGSSTEGSDDEHARYNELLALRRNELLLARIAEARKKAAERKRRLLEKRANQLLTGSTKSPFVGNDINSAEIRPDLEAIPFDEYQHNRIKTFYDDTWIGACAKCYFPSVTLLVINSSFLGMVVLSITLLQGYGEEFDSIGDTSYNVYGRTLGREFEQMVGAVTLTLCLAYALVTCGILPTLFIRRSYLSITYPEPISRVAIEEPLTDDEEEEMRTVERRAALKKRKEKRLRDKAEKQQQQSQPQPAQTADPNETPEAKAKREKRERREKRRSQEGGEVAEDENHLTPEEREALRQKRKRDKKKKREAEAAAGASGAQQPPAADATVNNTAGANGNSTELRRLSASGDRTSPTTPAASAVAVADSEDDDEEAAILKKASAEATTMRLPVATRVPSWAQYLFFPKGIIMSVETQRMFGAIVSYSRWHPAWATMPMWSPIVLIAGGSFPLRSISGSYGGCVTIFSFMAIFHLLFALVVAVFGPYRYRICNLAATMSYFATALLLILSAASVKNPSSDRIVMASIVVSCIQIFFSVANTAAVALPFPCFSSIMESSTLTLEWVYFAPYNDFRDRARQIPQSAATAAKSIAKALSEAADDMAMWCEEGEPVMPDNYNRPQRAPPTAASTALIPASEDVILSPPPLSHQPPDTAEPEEAVHPIEAPPPAPPRQEEVGADSDSLLGEPAQRDATSDAMLLTSAFNEIDIDQILSDVEAERLAKESSSPYLVNPFLEAEESFVPFMGESADTHQQELTVVVTERPSSPTIEAVSPILKKKKSAQGLRDRKVSIVEPHQLYPTTTDDPENDDLLGSPPTAVAAVTANDDNDESNLLGFPSTFNRVNSSVSSIVASGDGDDGDADSLDHDMGAHLVETVENASMAFSVLDGSEAGSFIGSPPQPSHHYQDARPQPILTNSSITEALMQQQLDGERKGRRHRKEGTSMPQGEDKVPEVPTAAAVDQTPISALQPTSDEAKPMTHTAPAPAPDLQQNQALSRPEATVREATNEPSVKEKKPKKDKSSMSPEELEAEAIRKKEKKEKKERREREAATAQGTAPVAASTGQPASTPQPVEFKEKSSKKKEKKS